MEDLHLEKRLHEGGKIRFPFFGNRKPSYSKRVSRDKFDKITREVRKALHKDQRLTDELIDTVFKQLRRFSMGEASVENAREVARKLGGYFELSEQFEVSVARYTGDTLVQFMSQHKSITSPEIIEINQSAESIQIRSAKAVYSAWLTKQNEP